MMPLNWATAVFASFVLGRIFEQPEIRVRLCVHGYAWRLPASLVFELPAGVHDALPDASWEGKR